MGQHSAAAPALVRAQMYLSANRIATLLQPRRLAEHALLERLVGFSSGLKQYMVRIALHVLLPVCSLDSNGRTSGVYRNADLRQNASFSQIWPTYVWTLPTLTLPRTPTRSPPPASAPPSHPMRGRGPTDMGAAHAGHTPPPEPPTAPPHMHTRESRVFQCAAARGAVSALHDPRSPAHPLRDTRIPMRRRAADTAACIDPLAPAARTLPHRTTTRPFTELRR